jgi:hypothetical protein
VALFELNSDRDALTVGVVDEESLSLFDAETTAVADDDRIAD